MNGTKEFNIRVDFLKTSIVSTYGKKNTLPAQSFAAKTEDL